MPLRSRLERHFHFRAKDLSFAAALAKLHRVFFLRLLLAGALLLACPGCAYFYAHKPFKRYHLVRVTDVEGRLIAEWVAEGYVTKTDRGYIFKAVERLAAGPGEQVMHYPYGRKVDIGGPNIVVSRTGKPLWLYEFEGE